MPEHDDRSPSGSGKVRWVSLSATIVFISGVAMAWIAAQGAIPVAPGLILGGSITISVALLCCSSYLLTGSYAARMPAYGEMEDKLKEGVEYFERGEWQEALDIFRGLMGPKMDHKRALYYAARCSEQLNDWEAVKLYCTKYLAMQPKDRDVWEMLANAHKRLFEYDEAEEAMNRASQLRSST
ncbi:MAG: hypothetical protein C4K49_09370 [Candidatus Thorarchaeota archaeon]|nr:MAG: hypothetical protein C4K49_09370 [Candidatus Thorarchaeota archaeon]